MLDASKLLIAEHLRYQAVQEQKSFRACNLRKLKEHSKRIDEIKFRKVKKDEEEKAAKVKAAQGEDKKEEEAGIGALDDGALDDCESSK